MNNNDDRRTAAPTPRAASRPDPVNLTDWARAEIPHLSEVSNSNPAASLQNHNLIAITDDVKTARVVALDFERTTSADNDITMIVLGHPVDRESKHQADPEGVTSHAARKTLLGGIPGAIVFALVIGLGVWLITGNGGATAGAAVGAAIFGFYSAGVWSFVIGTGQSEAFQQGFVDPDAADAIVVALHVDDHSMIEKARRAVSSDDRIRLFELDERGQTID